MLSLGKAGSCFQLRVEAIGWFCFFSDQACIIGFFCFLKEIQLIFIAT